MIDGTAEHPWQSLYTPKVTPDLKAPEWSVLEAFIRTVDRAPDAPALHYFGNTVSRSDLLDLVKGVTGVFQGAGVGPGDRVAVSLQNTPMFVATMLATWACGASMVPVNPMLRPDELTPVLTDSGAVVVVAHPEMAPVIQETVSRLEAPPQCFWSAPEELAGDLLPLPFPSTAQAPAGSEILLDLARTEAFRQTELGHRPDGSDPAFITYTSGTTGPSKGAVGTHANVAVQAVAYDEWFACDEATSVLTIAPLFHITGLGAHLALALAHGYPLVLTHRFAPKTVLDLIQVYKPTFAIGAITAFIAMLDASHDGGEILSELKILYSGGAPVPAHVVDRFEKASGRYIHNIYGLTETTSACIAVPLGSRAPVDQASGALSIGVPMGGTEVLIIDDSGAPVPPGQLGEIVVSGPQVASGYWNKPDETANAFKPEGMRTGDIGIMDEAGWVYVVDRKKDMVVVSGYKVWPRDVEDVIYQHPAVFEVAVVGSPDDYRGETLHAYVSLRQGQSATADELRAWCREKLSAYKVPTDVFFIEELPKTPTGKILRRALRD